MIYEQTPVRLHDGELDDFVDQYLQNVGATQAPSVMLEDESGRTIYIRPNSEDSVIVSEYEYEK